MNYYFLAASLPMISFDAQPLLTVSRFLEICADQLTPSDLSELEALLQTPGSETRSAFGRSLAARETGIRNAAARERASRLGCDPAPYIKECPDADISLRKAVGDALSKKDPMESERGLDRLRWTIADELRGYDPFSPAAIFSYGVQLAIAERWTKIDRAKGAQRLAELVTGLS
jgi:hypothetical protein